MKKWKRTGSFLLSLTMLFSVPWCSSHEECLVVNAAYENTHVNTGNQLEDILAVAKTQVGYPEWGMNHTKYNDWNGWLNPYDKNGNLLQYYDDSGYGYPWCHSFVSWCANQANIPTSVIPKTAGTATAQVFFKGKGRYQYSGSYTPHKGDLLYLTGNTHVALVYDVIGSTIYTIEGNFSDKVSYNMRNIGDSNIAGYGCPDYGSSSESNAIVTPKISTDKSSYTVGDTVTVSWVASPPLRTCHIIGL